MKIPLKEFEQHINATILSRGLEYFNTGAVTTFAQTAPGEYLAEVEGTNTYTVELSVSKGVAADLRCDCPYDRGAVCKHIVAVLFYLQADTFKSDRPLAPRPKKKRTKSVIQQLKELTQVVSHEELVDFFLKEARRNQKLKAAFMIEFGHLAESESQAFYQKQIRGILNSAAGRDGFIRLSEMKYVVNGVQPLIAMAEKSLTDGRLENVFYISAALLEESTQAFQYADDSGGDLGYLVNTAMEWFYKLAEEPRTDSLRNQLFSYCISAFEKQIFEGWDWHLDMLKIASGMARNKKEADVILNLLETMEGDYGRERAEKMTLNLLKRFGTEKEVAAYTDAHIVNPEIRNGIICEAIEQKEYERAAELCYDGIAYDQKDRPGLVITLWYNRLLEIAQAKGDINSTIEFARHLFIANFHPKQDYYAVLKKTIDAKDWNSFLDELIRELQQKLNWKNVELLRAIYIKEKRWESLLEMVKNYGTLEYIEANEKYLSGDFSKELIELYKGYITQYMEDFTGRRYYKKACRYMRRMKKLDGDTQVAELEAFLRKKYPQRVALIDELNNL